MTMNSHGVHGIYYYKNEIVKQVYLCLEKSKI